MMAARQFPLIILLALLASGGGEAEEAAKKSGSGERGKESLESLPLVDPKATAETRKLFLLLRTQAVDRLLFGHQDTTAYGVGWSGGEGKSDVKEVTGSFPAIYGWDIGKLGEEKNLDGVEFVRLRKLILNAHARGGITTISWHMDNPVTGRRYLDRRGKTNNVEEVIPGGSHHEQLKRRLDAFAEFLSQLQDQDGRPVPIIFRPWHENNQFRFWWSVKEGGANYIKLWRFTVEYLRDFKEVHHLLYAYSPLSKDYIREDNPAKYFAPEMGYPGAGYVDVFGLDDYSGHWEKIRASARVVATCAEARGKIGALTEVGPGAGLPREEKSSFYTGQLLRPLKDDKVARKIAYALVWRNSNRGHFWVPFKGHPDEEDFIKFCEDPWTLFEDDLPEAR